MEKSITVSVVIITYNHARYIMQSVTSILQQLPDDCEVIVVNDGSTDKTDDLLSQIQHKQVRILSKQNGGPSSALNDGILSSSGKYIAIFSGDDVSTPGGIAARLDFIRRTNADIASSIPAFINDAGQTIANFEMANVFRPLENMSSAAVLKHLLVKGNFICAPSVIMRRSVFDKIGLHLDALFQLQDYELWIRAALAGYKFSISETPFVHYRIHANNLSSSANNPRTVWEQIAILRKISQELDRKTLDQLSDQHAATDPDSVARALLFSDSNTLAAQVVGQELLEMAILDNDTAGLLKSKYNWGPRELLENRNSLLLKISPLTRNERRLRRLRKNFMTLKSDALSFFKIGK